MFRLCVIWVSRMRTYTGRRNQRRVVIASGCVLGECIVSRLYEPDGTEASARSGVIRAEAAR